ncbi:hypothetical protein HU200_009645 [Digitaria exilis]|uniref:Uncharacterized protein n=1 Tax=Digitaria exilis TaxID=1010633 RepID=A0A835FKD8_9POAL|nr:hypothetical protein HU200_009645 [Digitaria exilis]
MFARNYDEGSVVFQLQGEHDSYTTKAHSKSGDHRSISRDHGMKDIMSFIAPAMMVDEIIEEAKNLFLTSKEMLNSLHTWRHGRTVHADDNADGHRCGSRWLSCHSAMAEGCAWRSNSCQAVRDPAVADVHARRQTARRKGDAPSRVSATRRLEPQTPQYPYPPTQQKAPPPSKLSKTSVFTTSNLTDIVSPYPTSVGTATILSLTLSRQAHLCWWYIPGIIVNAVTSHLAFSITPAVYITCVVMGSGLSTHLAVPMEAAFMMSTSPVGSSTMSPITVTTGTSSTTHSATAMSVGAMSARVFQWEGEVVSTMSCAAIDEDLTSASARKPGKEDGGLWSPTMDWREAAEWGLVVRPFSTATPFSPALAPARKDLLLPRARTGLWSESDLAPPLFFVARMPKLPHPLCSPHPSLSSIRVAPPHPVDRSSRQVEARRQSSLIHLEDSQLEHTYVSMSSATPSRILQASLLPFIAAGGASPSPPSTSAASESLLVIPVLSSIRFPTKSPASRAQEPLFAMPTASPLRRINGLREQGGWQTQGGHQDVRLPPGEITVVLDRVTSHNLRGTGGAPTTSRRRPFRSPLSTVDEFLKCRCEWLIEEICRPQRELQELHALKLAPPVMTPQLWASSSSRFCSHCSTRLLHAPDAPPPSTAAAYRQPSTHLCHSRAHPPPAPATPLPSPSVPAADPCSAPCHPLSPPCWPCRGARATPQRRRRLQATTPAPGHSSPTIMASVPPPSRSPHRRTRRLTPAAPWRCGLRVHDTCSDQIECAATLTKPLPKQQAAIHGSDGF